MSDFSNIISQYTLSNINNSNRIEVITDDNNRAKAIYILNLSEVSIRDGLSISDISHTVYIQINSESIDRNVRKISVLYPKIVNSWLGTEAIDNRQNKIHKEWNSFKEFTSLPSNKIDCWNYYSNNVTRQYYKFTTDYNVDLYDSPSPDIVVINEGSNAGTYIGVRKEGILGIYTDLYIFGSDESDRLIQYSNKFGLNMSSLNHQISLNNIHVSNINIDNIEITVTPNFYGYDDYKYGLIGYLDFNINTNDMVSSGVKTLRILDQDNNSTSYDIINVGNTLTQTQLSKDIEEFNNNKYSTNLDYHNFNCRVLFEMIDGSVYTYRQNFEYRFISNESIERLVNNLNVNFSENNNNTYTITLEFPQGFFTDIPHVTTDNLNLSDILEYSDFMIESISIRKVSLERFRVLSEYELSEENFFSVNYSNDQVRINLNYDIKNLGLGTGNYNIKINSRLFNNSDIINSYSNILNIRGNEVRTSLLSNISNVQSVIENINQERQVKNTFSLSRDDSSQIINDLTDELASLGVLDQIQSQATNNDKVNIISSFIAFLIERNIIFVNKNNVRDIKIVKDNFILLNSDLEINRDNNNLLFSFFDNTSFQENKSISKFNLSESSETIPLTANNSNIINNNLNSESKKTIKFNKSKDINFIKKEKIKNKIKNNVNIDYIAKRISYKFDVSIISNNILRNNDIALKNAIRQRYFQINNSSIDETDLESLINNKDENLKIILEFFISNENSILSRVFY